MNKLYSVKMNAAHVDVVKVEKKVTEELSPYKEELSTNLDSKVYHCRYSLGVVTGRKLNSIENSGSRNGKS